MGFFYNSSKRVKQEIFLHGRKKERKKELTGYPSIDKPWLKYYTEEQINAPLPHMTAYEYLKTQNADRLDYTAIDSEIGCFTYGELFAQIDATAKALWAMAVSSASRMV